MNLLDSIFSKSTLFPLVHPIFTKFVEEFPEACTFLSLINRVVKLACFFYDAYEAAENYANQIGDTKDDKLYEAALNAAKLQYKSMHAIECLYGLKR